MYDHVHEKITVVASFSPHKRIEINSFVWKEKQYQIKQVTLVTKARKGREVVWMYHVVTDNMAFKLRLDTDSMTWWLEEFTWEQQNK